MDSSDENRTVTLQRNPLLISTVINRVFEYLPLEDLKQCRFVCHEWNSVSIQILNKQSEVKLYSKKQMTKFLELYKDYNTLAFPFTSFLVKMMILPDFPTYYWNTEDFEQLINEFNTLRENIITLRFQDGGDRLYLTPLIEAAPNLVTLTLLSCNSVVQLDKLSKVTNLSLIGCCVSLDSFGKRIAPLSIDLMEISFERNENKLQEILINDYIDFSGCSVIEITSSRDCVLTFDMSRDIVPARIVYFNRVRVINSRAAPAKVDKKIFPFEKPTRVGLGIKELYCRSSQLSLSLLPKSLEKLALDRNTYGSNNCVPVELPNLKYLILGPIFEDNGAANISPTSYDVGIIASMFRPCPKLVDMELWGMRFDDFRCDINVDLLPLSLKRVKLSDNKNINFVGDGVIHLDTLILYPGNFADAQKFMDKIKPKIVVVQLQSDEVEDPAGEIISFAEESWNWEKIVLKIPNRCADRRSYERTISNYVDDDDDESDFYEPNCYEFTNQVGKRLTRAAFNMYWFIGYLIMS